MTMAEAESDTTVDMNTSSAGRLHRACTAKVANYYEDPVLVRSVECNTKSETCLKM